MSVLAQALALTTLAGLATAVGGAAGILWRRPSDRFLGIGLAFSAGVMIAVSFIELLPSAMDELGFVQGNVIFLAGAIALFLLDQFIPHEALAARLGGTQDPQAMRVGLATAAGIALHNFPEGLAVLAGSLQSLELGALLAVAVAIHNVPEGMSVALPILRATGSRRRAFTAAFVSGVFEPLGALVAAGLLLPFLSPGVVGALLAFVAGIMVYVTLDELLPAAHRYESPALVVLSIILGMAVMIASLALLQ